MLNQVKVLPGFKDEKKVQVEGVAEIYGKAAAVPV